MGGRKGIVDIKVAIRGQLARERRIVGLLVGVETHILQQGDTAVFVPVDCGLCLGAHAVVSEGDRLSKCTATVEVGEQHHLRSPLGEEANGRKPRPGLIEGAERHGSRPV